MVTKIFQDKNTKILYKYNFSADDRSIVIFFQINTQHWLFITEKWCDNEISARVIFFEEMEFRIKNAINALQEVKNGTQHS